MRVSDKCHQMDQNWVVAGIPLRAPLKLISTTPIENQEDCSTTPTSAASRIPVVLACPPAPKKRKSAPARCAAVKEFFNPPDLDSIFISSGLT